MVALDVLLPPLAHPRRTIGRREFDFSRRVAVMAIVNRTPDSFYDRGRTFGLDAAVGAALAAVEAGADWIDIGGVKFAPGPEVPAAEEAARVVPVVEAVRARSDVVISVDTFRAEVAEEALAAGADVVNDTTGLADPRLADVVAASGATLVLTHSLAAPRQAHPLPHYDDVMGDVIAKLRDRLEVARGAGVPDERIVLDPGHDLNKTTRHSLALTRRLPELAALGFPVLAAVSNKDFIGETLDREKPQRLAGTLATVTACVLAGARIVRVHEVAPAIDAVRMTEAVLGLRDPAFERHNTADHVVE